ncbi:MAG: hypothetical protein EOP37_06930 [Rubrivivax sp.]|nr:MAG: hypothetical protein EOP37_06930 [Rubrivivax sp.]
MVEGMSKRLTHAGLSAGEAVAIADEIQTAILEAMLQRMQQERWKDYVLLFLVIVCFGSFLIAATRLFAL